MTRYVSPHSTHTHTHTHNYTYSVQGRASW